MDPTKKDIEKKVLSAARDNGISSILFRNALARKLNLNVTESMCLSLLTIKGLATPTEIAHFTGLTSGSTTTMLDRLEKIHFIKRKPNPVDRRGILVEITSDYTKKAAPLVTDIQIAYKKLIGKYSTSELEIIIDFLTNFTQNITDHTKKIEEHT